MSLILSGTDGLSDVDGTAATPAIRGTDANTGIFFPAADTIAFAEGGVEAMRLDSAGNLGLGVTPSAWSGVFAPAFQLRGAALSSQSNANITHLTQNTYYNSSSNPIYIATDYAVRYTQYQGQHQWYNAPSGTAGNAITFTQAMTLDASGNLLVGTTSAGFSTSGRGLIEVNGTSESLIALKRNGSATTAGYFYQNATDMRIVQRENLPMLFYTNDNERARIDSSGNLGVGVTPSAWRNTFKALQILGTATLSSNSNTTVYLGSNWYNNSSGADIYTVTGAAGIYAINAGVHLWYNAPSGTAGNPVSFTQAMTLDASGTLLLGSTASASEAWISLKNNFVTKPAINVFGNTAGDAPNSGITISKYDNSSATTQILIRFVTNNGANGSGQINANGANSAAFGTFSDRRLKENIVDLPPQLANIMALRPVEYDYIESEGGGHQIGFIAQEVQAIYSDLVGERTDGMLTLSDMNKNDARLIKAMQEMKALIDTQALTITTLTARISALESA
jgi:hypothetical protein